MKKQSFLKGSAVLMMMVLITKILGLAYKIPLTSMLGGSGMSCYSGAFAVFAPVFSLAAGGITGAVSSMISQQLALGRYKNAVRLRRAAAVMFFFIALMLSAVVILCSGSLSAGLIHDSEARLALIAVALSLPIQSLVNVRRGWAEGLGSMNSTAASEIIETAAKLVIGLAAPYFVMRTAEMSFEKYHGCFGHYCADIRQAELYALPFAAAASAAGVTAASLICCIFLHIQTKKASKECEEEFSGYSLSLDISRAEACRRLLKRSLPASLIMLVSSLSGTVDLVTIAPCLERAMKRQPTLFAYLGDCGIKPEERASFVYGSYTGLALMIFGLLPTFTAMLGKSVLPALSSAIARKRREEVDGIVGSMLLLSSGIALPGGLGVCILSEPLLRLMFPGARAEIMICSLPLSILGIGVILMGISLPCLTALQACGKQLPAMFISLCGTAVKLILNVLLISLPGVNICGAAISTVVSHGLICAASAAFLIKGSGASPSVVKKLFMPVIPALLCSFTAYLTQDLIIGHTEGKLFQFGVLISVAFGAIVCLISFGLLCISPKNQIMQFFSKKIVKST